MRCILHVGTIKTGTTAIQESFARRPPEGALLFQARSGLANSSQILSSAYETDPEHHARFHPKSPVRDPSVRGRFLKMLDRTVAEAGPGVHTLVISGERAFVMSEGALRDLAADLAERFERVQAVAYIRPFAGFVSSAFQESIKHRHRMLEDIQAPMQEPRLRFLDGLFGRENTILAPFDRARMEGGDVVCDFAARLGLSHDPADTVQKNESLSLEGTALLYAVRRRMMERSDGARPILRADAGLLKLCRRLGSRRFSLGPALLEPLRARMEPQAEFVEARVGYPAEQFLRLPESGVEDEEGLLRPLFEPGTLARIEELLAPGDLGEGPAGLVSDALSGIGAVTMPRAESTPRRRKVSMSQEAEHKLRRQVARALWQVEIGKEIAVAEGRDSETYAAAWQRDKQEMNQKAARLIDLLSRSGVEITSTEGE